MGEIDVTLLRAIAVLETKVEALEKNDERHDRRLLALEHKTSKLEGAELKGDLRMLQESVSENAEGLAVGREAIIRFNRLQERIVEYGVLSKDQLKGLEIHVGDKTNVRSERDAIVSGRDQEVDRDG